MSAYFWIGLGSALGGIGRFWISGIVSKHCASFPLGTLTVNVTGSFLIGLLASIEDPSGRWIVSPTGRQFLIIGLLGGYTTFSSFSLQTLTLARDGSWGLAGLNVLGSVILCLTFVWLGHLIGQSINSR